MGSARLWFPLALLPMLRGCLFPTSDSEQPLAKPAGLHSHQ